jgi:hypothetical protein
VMEVIAIDEYYLHVNPVGRTGRGRHFGARGDHVGRVQAEHLLAAGHRRPGYALPENERAQTIASTRLEGVELACREHGLAEPLVLTFPLDPAAAAEAVRTWPDAEPPVTGVCCFNDNVALAVLAGLRTLGLRAPGDLAVIGVDDIEAARLADPPLTTVTTDMHALATHVAETIATSLNGGSRSRRAGAELVHLIRRCSARSSPGTHVLWVGPTWGRLLTGATSTCGTAMQVSSTRKLDCLECGVEVVRSGQIPRHPCRLTRSRGMPRTDRSGFHNRLVLDAHCVGDGEQILLV